MGLAMLVNVLYLMTTERYPHYCFVRFVGGKYRSNQGLAEITRPALSIRVRWHFQSVKSVIRDRTLFSPSAFICGEWFNFPVTHLHFDKICLRETNEFKGF